MLRSPLLAAVATVAAVLALNGCSSSTESVKTAAPWTLRYNASTPVRLATQTGGVVLDGSTAIFPFSDRTTGPQDSLGSVDLATGKRTVLARTRFRGGSIVAAVHAGNEVVYVDESARGDLTPGTASWQVIALDSHRVLASSGSRRVTMSPDLTAIDGAAVWTVYPDQGGGSLRAFGWKPGGQVARRDALPNDETTCTAPTTKPELVVSCAKHGDWVAWVEKADPQGTVGDDSPGHLFAGAVNGGTTRRVGGVPLDATPEVFGDYLLWDKGTGLEVTSLEHPSVAVDVLTSMPDVSSTFYVSQDGGAAAVVTQGDGTTILRAIGAGNLRLRHR